MIANQCDMAALQLDRQAGDAPDAIGDRGHVDCFLRRPQVGR